MDEFTDKSVLLKEVKGYEIPSAVLRDSKELSDGKLQGDAVRVVEVEHGTKQIDMSVGEEAMRFECRGIGLEEKLAQLSIGEGELLLVRLRRRRQAGKKNQNAEEQHQSNARDSYLGSDCDEGQAKRAGEKTDTGRKLEDGYKADKDCEWKQPKKKDEAFQYSEQPPDKEKENKPNLKARNVRQKIQTQRKREELQLHKIKPKQKVVSDTQRQRGVNLGLPHKFKQQQKEKEKVCLRDQLKEKYEGIDEVQKELHKKEQEFAIQETNLTKMGTQLSELRGQLREKSAQEAALLEQPRTERQQVTELQGQLRTREKEASTMQQELSNLRSEVEEKDRNMAALQERSRVEQQQVTALLNELKTREEEARTMKQQMFNVQGELQEKDTNTASLQERLGAKQQQVTELQNQMGTNEEEIRTMRQQLNNLHGQLLEKNADMSTLQRKEERRFTELQRLFQEVRTMRVRLTNLRDQEQQSKVELQRVTELNNQLTINEQEIRELRQQITDLQVQGERLKMEQERVTELQSQLTTNEQEIRTLRQQITDFHGQGERLRMEQERVTELQSQLTTNEQQCLELRQQITVLREREEQLRMEQETQHGENESRPDWAINRTEIKMTEQELGRGAWATVTQGEYCGVTVAVKQIHDEIISVDFLNLFKREMNIASKCRHPCLLHFIGGTNDDGSPLFVTELMETSLRALLEQRQISETEITVISLDVARALNYLHQKKPEPIIHRDVSSANVLLWRQGDQWRGKVSDYGTANFMKKTKTIAPGARIYSAPEALTINQTEKIDVYSFGVLLCEMCINEDPDPDQRQEQISRMANEVFRNLVSRCVKKKPGERPSMQVIIAELEPELNRNEAD